MLARTLNSHPTPAHLPDIGGDLPAAAPHSSAVSIKGIENIQGNKKIVNSYNFVTRSTFFGKKNKRGVQGVSKKRYFCDFLSYFSSRGRILLFHMCFGIGILSPFHLAIQKVSMQNLKTVFLCQYRERRQFLFVHLGTEDSLLWSNSERNIVLFPTFKTNFLKVTQMYIFQVSETVNYFHPVNDMYVIYSTISNCSKTLLL